jgi:hypothetical protein
MRLSSSTISRTFLVLISLLCCARAAAPRPVSSPPRRTSRRRLDDEPAARQSVATSSAPPDFAKQVNPPSLTASATGVESNGLITLTGTGGFAGTVELSCEISPDVIDPVSCFLFGGQVNVDSNNSPSMTMFVVAAVAPSCMDINDGLFPGNPGSRSRWLAEAETGLVMLALLTCATRFGSPRYRTKVVHLAIVCAVGLVMAGCGESTNSGFQCSTGVPNAGTPVGMYMITMTATSGSISHSTTVPLTVTSAF